MNVEIQKVDPEKFAYLLSIVGLVMSGKMQARDPSEKAFFLDGEEYRFADTPLTRAFAAMSDEFRDLGISDLDLQISYSTRIFSFHQIAKEKRFSKFFRKNGENSEVSKSLVNAISVCKCKTDGTLDKKDLYTIANSKV